MRGAEASLHRLPGGKRGKRTIRLFHYQLFPLVVHYPLRMPFSLWAIHEGCIAPQNIAHDVFSIFGIDFSPEGCIF
jgi:hypothetical protein